MLGFLRVWFQIAVVVAVTTSLTPLEANAQTTGSVRGFVRFFDGNRSMLPIPGAIVEVEGPSGEWKTETNGSGFYVIFGIPPGRYVNA